MARGLVHPLTIEVSSLNTHTTPTSLMTLAVVFSLGAVLSAAVPAHVAPSILSLFCGILSVYCSLHYLA